MFKKMVRVVLSTCIILSLSVVVLASERTIYEDEQQEASLVFEYGDPMPDPLFVPFSDYAYEISILECGNESGIVPNDAMKEVGLYDDFSMRFDQIRQDAVDLLESNVVNESEQIDNNSNTHTKID